MDPKTQLLEYKQKVDAELEFYLQKKVTEYEKISDFAGKFTRDLKEFTLRGGKRLRPALVYHSYKLFGGKEEEKIIKASMFIELIETFLLIHDDIMDRSILRRGKTTMHKIYEKYSGEQKFQDDLHFGTTMAILSGDLANQMALEIISESDFPLTNKNKVIGFVSREISTVIFGQIHDVLLGYDFPKEYNENDVLKVHLNKTARYTYKLPLFAGAILVGATDEELKAVDGYAMQSGIAFQIRDDILGVFGDSEETGKDIRSDIMEGKKTLLVTEAYKNGTNEQKEMLDKYLGKKDLTEVEFDQVKAIFKNTGSLEYSMKECKEHIGKAKESLSKLSSRNKEAYQFLEKIADYIIVRKV